MALKKTGLGIKIKVDGNDKAATEFEVIEAESDFELETVEPPAEINGLKADGTRSYNVFRTSNTRVTGNLALLIKSDAAQTAVEKLEPLLKAATDESTALDAELTAGKVGKVHTFKMLLGGSAGDIKCTSMGSLVKYTFPFASTGTVS